MLENPVSWTDYIEGRISPKEIFELKIALERQGKRLEFHYDYESDKVHGEYARCIGCGIYSEWHELNLRGKGERRNQCRDCYRYYHYYQKADESKTLKRHTAKERQRQLAHDLWGGWYWSYMIKTIVNGKLALYFGATENMISREMQHYAASSNPATQDLFVERKQALVDNIFAFVRPIAFYPQGHNTLEEAYRRERELWEYWTQRDDVLVLNVNAPSGAPPIKNAA